MTADDPGRQVEDARAALDRMEQTLADVSATLGRLDEGTYGSCEACGQPIDEERLAAAPPARRCERCEHPGTG